MSSVSKVAEAAAQVHRTNPGASGFDAMLRAGLADASYAYRGAFAARAALSLGERSAYGLRSHQMPSRSAQRYRRAAEVTRCDGRALSGRSSVTDLTSAHDAHVQRRRQQAFRATSRFGHLPISENGATANEALVHVEAVGRRGQARRSNISRYHFQCRCRIEGTDVRIVIAGDRRFVSGSRG